MFPYLRSIEYFREDYKEVLNLKKLNEINNNLDMVVRLADSIESLITYRDFGGIDDAEKKSWIYSMKNMDEYALMQVNKNVKIAFEYLNDYRISDSDNAYIGDDGLIGYSKRVDVMLGGKNAKDENIILAFELKSWSANNIFIVKSKDKRKKSITVDEFNDWKIEKE